MNLKPVGHFVTMVIIKKHYIKDTPTLKLTAMYLQLQKHTFCF